MTAFLLILILVLLIVLSNKTSANYTVLKRSIDELSQKIDNLSKYQFQEKETQKAKFDSPQKTSIIKEEKVEESKKQIETEKVTPPTKKEIEEVTEINLSNANYTSKPITNDSEKVQEPINEPEEIQSPTPTRKSFWQKFKEKNPDLEKFIGENLINKIGILILVLGISYFVKYAIDKNWINEPARVGIGILAGALILVIAHKLRKKYSAFSSVLVAGSIAILYFTIGIAYHEYQLFNQNIAFTLMVIITTFSSIISISYNRIELAILSLIGGFGVPFMISSGTGNYIVLFTYIFILNIGILAIAYYKKWNLVNILAFIFTTLLFGGWFIKEMASDQPQYLGALLFAFAFYLIFIITNIINNISTKGSFSKIQLGILIFNTFIFYSIGMVIFNEYHTELKGLFTVGLGVLNFIYAWLLYKKFKLDKIAVYLLIGLTLTFITLAIPIQFEGNYITLFWAAEAVLLMWLAKKSKIKSYRFASAIVHVLMLVSLAMDWEQKYNSVTTLTIVINPIFATGLFGIASLFLVYYLLKNEHESLHKWKLTFNPNVYRNLIFTAGILLSYFVGLFEVLYQSFYFIDNIASALSIPAIYHLLFTAIVSFISYKKRTLIGNQLVNVIAIFNIIVYLFSISILTYGEHKAYLVSGINIEIAFYLHYLSLALICFFGYLIYITNKLQLTFPVYKKKAFIWIAALVVIYIFSNEVMLHGLKILNSPVTAIEVEASEYYDLYKDNLNYLYDSIATSTINQTKLKIIKTSFPVLWGILAFIFLLIGIKKQIKTLRIIALVLLAITIVKLFLYDITNVSETGKIIAFILLGILILIISFVYQKIKVLIIDDDKLKHENEDN
ncbi:DUF2339 domain-containing protein [Aureibaculum marinum]|uniref:DUF2339 domain-containing protein n=1 Tax=Aureibaculum marinum TaxID=2487930 RepID=A0A3N4P308_9FLAO|nr:DUF2339 domain-containing protein [Aureibaculum marinum]RPD98169.1 DUF2339 domain-containing protein [Aureibaculum marinum]